MVYSKRYLLYGEGDDEQQFFTYLRMIYAVKDPTNPSIRNGGGGNPANIIRRMKSLPQFAGFDKHLVIFDSDVSDGKVRSGIKLCETSSPPIKYYLSTPRFEVEMLRLIGYQESQLERFSGSNSKIAKTEYHKYFDSTIKDGEKSFANVLGKDKLDSLRHNSKWLDTLIKFIEECNK